MYLAKRDHSFITESIKSEHWNTTLPAVPLSPVLAPREKTPLLPKDSRPPPVIYDASMGGIIMCNAFICIMLQQEIDNSDPTTVFPLAVDGRGIR